MEKEQLISKDPIQIVEAAHFYLGLPEQEVTLDGIHKGTHSFIRSVTTRIKENVYLTVKFEIKI